MQAYVIDPAARQIELIDWVGIPPGTPHNLTALNHEGDVLMSFDRHALHTRGMFVMDYRSEVYLGKAFVLNSIQGQPYVPIAALLRQVNWVSTLMVCNGAKTIIPTRPVIL
ncbi:hypothetical protein CPT_Seuss90 [Caulobacter phage Seuss]|uniref:Uncharacterized protein n=1 Tax=Caulobacter phage Seuss TaxID=1675601 RepID=A0A0K1LM85_9CAUD|nr:hypothetical protein HOR08_gp090 [Caulobacter phage Seuss]AKU43616.1 hypothetical protein CPT_Seuss90 [Caulobacter phage Seuss]